MAPKIIGTAGHIDHGKSSLVKYLTGTDPDRLKEEQERGMTIDIGFAFLNDELAFVDVPGHEKFIKNMVAGVSTVDLALLVVAADDGVMPQTREHLDILKLLRLERGVIALTKIDLVDLEWLDMVEEDVRRLVRGTFLESAPLVRVSSATGEGMEALRRILIETAEKTPPRADRGFFWMPVDRSFTIKGHGTVVTGSVLSGSVAAGEMLEVLPAQLQVRVRGIQVHGRSAARVSVGERAALNLHPIAKEEIGRGDILASPERAKPTNLLDVRLTLLPGAAKALNGGAALRLHIGTAEISARVRLLDRDTLAPGETAPAQLRLLTPTAALKRQPFIIRRLSPAATIGGGIVLDPCPRRHRRHDPLVLEHLEHLERLEPTELLLVALAEPNMSVRSAAELAKRIGITEEEAAALLNKQLEAGLVRQIGRGWMHRQNFLLLKERLRTLLAAFHQKEPLRPGMKKAYVTALLQTTAEAMQTALQELEAEGLVSQSGDLIRLADFRISLPPQEQQLADAILDIFARAPFGTPPPKILAQMTGHAEERVRRVLNALLGMERIVRLDEEIYLSAEAVSDAEQRLFRFLDQRGEIGVGEFRELLGTSRKFALPLLNYFDQKGLTERVGEIRRLRKEKSRS